LNFAKTKKEQSLQKQKLNLQSQYTKNTNLFKLPPDFLIRAQWLEPIKIAAATSRSAAN